ncbi:hypothetical protein T484DRAFT_1752229 [Baffinella frigidus]|jgi:hypothetical protein|nr:hypothetical protein T484DRAFT_1752229 [Cryptophyta sp. CCMP2293]
MSACGCDKCALCGKRKDESCRYHQVTVCAPATAPSGIWFFVCSFFAAFWQLVLLVLPPTPPYGIFWGELLLAEEDEELDLTHSRDGVVDAHNAGDGEAREDTVEALLAASCCDALREKILGCFALAHVETCNAAQTAVFKERQIDLLGGMRRFEEQAWAMLQFAMTLQKQGDFAR